jgi:hypothetical protein
MSEITAIPTVEHELPSIKEPGSILFHARDLGDGKFEFEVFDHSGSTFWIQEGMGFDYFLSEYVEIPHEGLFLVSGIVGTWIRGDGWTTDDDEDWEHGEVTPIGLGSFDLTGRLHAMGYQRVFNAISGAVSIWPEAAKAKAKAQGYGISISVAKLIEGLAPSCSS